MATEQQFHRVGKRKSAIARVYLRNRSGDVGTIRINRRPLEDYFPRDTARRLILQPLELTGTVNQYDIHVNVKGGGLSGQAGAVRHGIARALNLINIEYRPALKKAGLLTRDSRAVERKKYGMAGARRKFQYSKR
jgi:small subunit ribosomal protein S9